MKVTLVRHGQTEDNFLGKLQGHVNNLMNDTGRRQCKNLALRIKEESFDYCYMSPLVRCVETALILVGDRVMMIPDKRLIERNIGELEGRPQAEYNAYKFWDYSYNRDDYGVEPIKDLFERCQDFLNYIYSKHSDCSILIVTHSGPYRALRHLLLNHNLNGNLLDSRIDNCMIETFEYKR